MLSTGNCHRVCFCGVLLTHAHMCNQEKKKTDIMKDKLDCLKQPHLKQKWRLHKGTEKDMSSWHTAMFITPKA